MYRIEVRPKAGKQLAKLDPRYRKAVRFSIDSLTKNPYTGKKLDSPLNHLYSLRVGVYRILYQIFKKQLIILVISVAHRKEVYQRK